MAEVVAIHSYRGGTGKSNLTANVAWLAARSGKRVAVLDADLHSPGVHVVLGLEKERIAFTLTDYVFGRCELEEAAYDVGPSLGVGPPGALYLLPSSMKLEAIAKVASEGYDVGRLNDHLADLAKALRLDVLFVDTHPGLNRETMLTTAVATTLVIVVRPDQQDVHGTAVLVQAAARLSVPRVLLVANKVPSSIDAASVKARFEEAFGHEVVACLPLDEDMVALGSAGLFVVRHPDHPLALELAALARRVVPA
jgi:MinD-like ATPase involved in chromosome partitioning or flagellar assembly